MCHSKKWWLCKNGRAATRSPTSSGATRRDGQNRRLDSGFRRNDVRKGFKLSLVRLRRGMVAGVEDRIIQIPPMTPDSCVSLRRGEEVAALGVRGCATSHAVTKQTCGRLAKTTDEHVLIRTERIWTIVMISQSYPNRIVRYTSA